MLALAHKAGLVTKSGLILGMGEEVEEVRGALADLRAVGVRIVTLGQYLRPSASHIPVSRWWTPEEFDEIGSFARQPRLRPCGVVAVDAFELPRAERDGFSESRRSAERDDERVRADES